MYEIENIEIRFTGSANFKEVEAKAAALNTQLKAMQYQLAQLPDKKIRDYRTAMNALGKAQGGVVTEAVRAKSATTAFTEALVKQDLAFTKHLENRRMMNKALKEQYQLQRMTTVQWGRTATGKVKADVILPKGISDEVNRLTDSWKYNAKEMIKARAQMAGYTQATTAGQEATKRFSQASDVMRMRLGMNADMLSSYSSNMVKWGKNTQWAGRQLMVGFTVPFLALAAVAGIAANNVDKEMTRILKVYDYSAEAQNDSALREAEANKIRTLSMEAAGQTARQYGVAVKETLEIEAELAATGMTGLDLVKRTTLLNKAMIMGELDKQQAIKASTALQTAYGHSTTEMNEDFNYMATLANATSLSMTDFVEGLPRGAATLKNVGVELKDLGVLMAALKQSGVAAGEGMNSLRSGAQKVLQPTKKAEDTWSSLLPSAPAITEVVDKYKGQFMPIMIELGKHMKGLDQYQKQKVITNLFGIHRADNMFKVMSGILNQTNQVGKAMEVANMSAQELETVAANSLATVTNSASNKIARAIETLKYELSKLGATFLPVAAQVMQAFGSFVNMFNGMDEGKKKLLIYGAALVSVAAVVTMMVGLFSNLMGTLMGVTMWVAKAGLRFRTMTVEQKAQAMLAQSTAAAWRDQGLAAQTLSRQLQMLIRQFDKATLAKERNSLANMTGGGVVQQYKGTQPGIPGPNIPAGTPVVVGTNAQGRRTISRANARQIEAERNLAHSEALVMNEQRIAQASATTKRNWAAIGSSAAGVGIAAGMIATSLGNAQGASRNLMDNMLNTLLIAALVGPTFAKALTSARVTAALANVKMAFAAGRMGPHAAGRSPLVAGLRSALPAAGALAGAIARFAGPVGLLVSAGLLIKGIRDGLDEAREKQDKITNSAKDWAKVLGFTYTQLASNGGQKTDAEKAGSLAKRFRDANKAVAENLDLIKETGTQEELINAAIQEGVKARMHGADAGQARLAVATALAAVETDEKKVEKMMVDVDAQINFTDMTAVARAQGKHFAEVFNQAMNNEMKADKWITRMWESAKGGLTASSIEAAKGAGKEFWNAFDSQESAQAKKEFFEGVEAEFARTTDSITNKVNDSKEMQRYYGATGEKSKSWDQYADIAARGDEALWAAFPMDKKNFEAIRDAAKAERTYVQEMARGRGISEDKIKTLNTMVDLHKILNIAELTTGQAIAGFNEEMALASRGGEELTEGQKLLILNTWRGKAGMDAATESAQGFGGALMGASGGVDELGNSIDSSIMTVEEWGNAWSEATRKTMDGAQNMALEQAEVLRAEQQADIMAGIDAEFDRKVAAADSRAERASKKIEDRADALSARHDREGDALTDRQKKREKALAAGYDNRIKKIQDAIDAEKAAEDERQRIFEAEKKRLERLADMENRNIDFNVAINTGNVDEAAKLFNDMANQQSQWAIDDATEGSESASEKRIAGREKQIDGIEKSRDAALEALKDKEDAEKDALKAKQDREKKALDAEKERHSKATESNKKNLDKQREDAKRTEEARLANMKHRLEMELMVIRASTPRNKKEYDAQIKAIEGAYGRYGLRLKDSGNRWSKYIGDYLTSNVSAAAASLRNDINWKAYASKIANDFSTGAFNMDIAEFGKLITTGKAPNDAFKQPTNKRINSTQAGAHGAGGSREVRHAGGLLGGKGSSRRGYAASNSPMASEVELLAKKGEYVVNDKAVRKYGVGVMDEINEGKFGNGQGGANLGLAGILGGGLFAQMKNAMQMGLATAAMRKMEMTGNVNASIGKQDAFGNIKLDASQIRNAQAIMATGKSLGASKRDLTIALMTAMQESTLRNINYGDRDSVGLFQQRPSQGWGSVEQIMDPKYAATKFFKGLFNVSNRDAMPMTLAAQAVQRSAFPYAYAKWQGMAEALVNGTNFSGGGMSLDEMLKAVAMGGPSSGGGKPVKAGQYRVSSEYGMRTNPVTGIYKLHDGIDLAASGGTPIYSVKSGRVLSAGVAGGYGNYTVIQHEDGTQAGYAHQSRINVTQGQEVRAGQNIGAVGTTGNSTGNHLHFQMGRNGQWLNPRNFIPGLAKGGFTLNDGYAMLHKNETVLTADLSEKLKTGITNISEGGNRYAFTIDLRGTIVNKEVDLESAIEKGVTKALNAKESKMGRSRKVNA